MALIITGGGVAAASGSTGGTVYSRNRGGSYIRNRSMPTNPNTAQQQVVRSAMSVLAAAWNDTLTAAQRAAWDLYAENVPLLNPLGQPRNVGGVGMYVRGNVPRIQSGVGDLPRVDSGPTTFNLGEFTAPTISGASEATQQISLTLTNTDAWANEDDAGMLVFVGRPQNPGINYFKGPYRFALGILGDSVTPPTSPAAVSAPFPFSAGHKLFVRTVVTRSDGRLSSTWWGSVTAAA